MHTEFLIIGAGIFGIATAVELRKRGYSVTVLNPDQIPHPLAATTDISKIVRMEYGSDVEYMDMTIESMELWREWNDLFNEKIYHEIGFLLLSSESMDHESQKFEKASFENLIKKGFQPERLSTEKMAVQFPAFNNKKYKDGFFNKIAGYAESGRAVELLVKYAKEFGVKIMEGQTAEKIIIKKNKAEGVKTKEGELFNAENIIVCAGNFTPYLIPEIKPFFKITGHPVFHLKPKNPELFTPPNFAVFTADVSNTGWYGFPFHPKEKVVKIALHSEGLDLHPERDERIVYKSDEEHLRNFLKASIPALADAPIVYTRRCCYTDTLDGHFWIDRHPEINNLMVGSGGSGHGFKMGPIIGQMMADVAEGKSHKWSNRYKWRELGMETVLQEEARFLKK